MNIITSGENNRETQQKEINLITYSKNSTKRGNHKRKETPRDQNFIQDDGLLLLKEIELDADMAKQEFGDEEEEEDAIEKVKHNPHLFHKSINSFELKSENFVGFFEDNLKALESKKPAKNIKIMEEEYLTSSQMDNKSFGEINHDPFYKEPIQKLSNENKKKQIKDLFIDYDFKVDHSDNKKLFRSSEEEKKLFGLNLLKNKLNKNFKRKRKEGIIRESERQYQLSQIDHLTAIDKLKKTVHPKELAEKMDQINEYISHTKKKKFYKNKKRYEIKKINKKSLHKRNKRKEHKLRIKKIKKQIKKKRKIKCSTFISKVRYLEKKDDLSKYVTIDNWENCMEEQLKDYYNNSNPKLNEMVKKLKMKINELKYEMEKKLLDNRIENWELGLFSGKTYVDKPNEIQQQQASVNETTINKSSSEFNDSKIREEKIKEYKRKLKIFKDGNSSIISAYDIKVEALAGIVQPKPSDTPGAKLALLEPQVKINENLRKSVKTKLNEEEKLRVKQRMINFSMKIFDKFDLKKIIIFWRDNRNNQIWQKRCEKIKESSKKNLLSSVKTGDTLKDADKAPEEKKKTKNDIFVKQNYAQPSDNIRKYIPFCSNIYNIQRNEN